MITRSRARLQRASTPPSNKRKRIERTHKVARRDYIAPVIYEGEDMVRRGGTSGRRSSKRLNPDDPTQVTPVRLFPMAEEEIREGETVSRVSYQFLQAFRVVD